MHPDTVRFSIFIGLCAVLALWEVLDPWRKENLRSRRWPSNVALVVLDTALVRLLFPVTAAGLALICERNGVGMFNLLTLPGWIVLPVSVIALDAAIYGQHVLFHKIPALWRLHRVHHADVVLDVTSGLRFHPAEIVLSMLIKFAAVAALGAPAIAVMVFEVLLNATAMFNHANIRLSRPVEAVLRLFVVTPDMHRIHHSAERIETDSNYGFNLPWWDRLFGTYRDEPAAGREGVTIGLENFRDPAESRIDSLLTQPLRTDVPKN